MNQYKLKDVAISQTGPFGSQLHEEDYVANGIPIVTVEHLGDIGFTTQNLPMVSEKDACRLKKYCLKKGDIVFSRVGSIDRNVYTKEDQEGWLFSGRCIRVRCDITKVNPRYLSFYFKLPSFKQMMFNRSVGATMPSLNTDIMDDLPLLLLNRNEQDKVAKILGGIDDKIENNNTIVAQLEALAKTIYDYWFVQFDFPDENGRPYKSSGGKMVWNERLQREIPDGWRVGCIADITANVTDGEHGTILNENHSGYYLLSCKNIIGGRLCYDESARQVSLKSFEKMRKRTELAEGDVLVSSVGTIGEACVMTADCDHVEFQRSVAILKPDYSKISSEWLYETMLSMKPIMQRNAHGAIQQCIFISDIKNLFVVIPPSQIIEIYTDKVQSLLKLKIKKEEENQKLASLRDFLLPLLMNGQVSFKSDSI